MILHLQRRERCGSGNMRAKFRAAEFSVSLDYSVYETHSLPLYLIIAIASSMSAALQSWDNRPKSRSMVRREYK